MGHQAQVDLRVKRAKQVRLDQLAQVDSGVRKAKRALQARPELLLCPQRT